MNDISKNIRKSILHMVHYSKSSHVGTCLSMVDILAVLYFKFLRIDPTNPKLEGRDKFILSKGHGGAALYATLAERGFFPKEYLNKYYVDDGILPGHLDMTAVPGIESSAGSLGHGLSIGIGMAYANRSSNIAGEVIVLLGDGECNEGSVWEGIMYASSANLTNLTAIVDYNKLQSFGRTNEVVNQENMSKRWESFGWHVIEIDGHNHEAIEQGLNHKALKPKVIIAHTIKGKGVSYMEDRLEWHYKSPSDEQLKMALKELGE
ncbi:transketolase [Paenibacillus marchantiophytorum]|uniref:Transketolase n=1 Tax=Paenibacillus marchantiophytorum TaxID=1619310 RepID=A0ABQ2BUS0_9BACL|nr:transketolase [Paenibacillus marchantiophytorum]GGI46218.1 transketolase [Paenibacillus marchantiophytorum]